MKPRVLIFDNNEVFSSTLKKILDERGYNAFTFSDPGVCPLFHSGDHIGISDSVCSDIIISDLYMPTIDGLKLIKDRIDTGCKVKFRALMSMGCRLFRKPFDLQEMLEWLDDCAKKIDTERKLFNWSRNKKID
jgi:DNA-binding response OmpR family regulator